MKKISNFLMVAMIAFMGLTLTSCLNEDEEMACHLNGEWQGMITDQNAGRVYDVTMRFVQRGLSNDGYGYEEDLNHRWYSSNWVRFNWHIDDRAIYLEYEDGARYVMEFRGSRPYGHVNDKIEGFFYNTDTNRRDAFFSLVKTSSDDYSNYSYDGYAKETKTADEE